MRKSIQPIAVGLIFLFLSSLQMAAAGETVDAWPRRVLITNDNGINDIKIVKLAQAFSRIAETYVVAPSQDRSGSTNFISVFRNRNIKIHPQSLGDGIKAYSVDGYPADCVLLGIFGLMAEHAPDLVVSGINGGPNLGVEWFGSGTIGAARTAAISGLPAIAVSGLRTSCQPCVEAATAWVVELAQSEFVRKLEPGQYLTVSIPRKLPSNIKGIKIIKRASRSGSPIFMKAETAVNESDEQEWIYKGWEASLPASKESDVAVYDSDYIAIVPMQVDENDFRFLSILQKKSHKIPGWPPSLVKK
jgi:5'-nucleotidase